MNPTFDAQCRLTRVFFGKSERSLFPRGCIVAITFLVLIIHPQTYLSTAHALEFKWINCSSDIQSKFEKLMEELPTTLTKEGPTKAEIECTDKKLAYGFNITNNKTPHLELGASSQLGTRRSEYRLEQLRPSEQLELWHQRGLIHLLLRHGSLNHSWHLHPSFRSINGWNRDGTQSTNNDDWAYSRPVGKNSALDDFVTFGEEWFIRPSRRLARPDNRVECQSFWKARFLNEVFALETSAHPAKACKDFWKWHESFPFIDLIFTSPTSQPISSFGHLAIVLRSIESREPEPNDPVFQYVGVIGSQPGHKSATEALTSRIPLILSPEPFMNFERRTTLMEDRRLYRFQFRLKPSEAIWFKAKLWEHTRRFQGDYGFLHKNCASSILDLVAQSVGHKLQAPGPTRSPDNVVSTLIEAKLIDPLPKVHASISDQLAALQRTGKKIINRQHKSRRFIPKLAPPTHTVKRQWQAFLAELQPDDISVAPYLYLAQDYFELAAWLSRAQSTTIVPVQPRHYLELRHQLFHEEQTAEEFARRLLAWQRQVSQHETKELKTEDESPDGTSVYLVEEITETIFRLGLTSEMEFPPHIQDAVAHGPASRPWGSDGSVLLGYVYNQKLGNSAIEFQSSLYETRQSDGRASWRSTHGDKRILGINLETDENHWQVRFTPFFLHQRAYLFDVTKLGALVETQLTVSSTYTEAFIAAGPSIQLLSFESNAGDVSIAPTAALSFRDNRNTAISVPVTTVLNLPLGKSFTFRGRVQFAASNAPFDLHAPDYSAELEVHPQMLFARRLTLIMRALGTNEGNDGVNRSLTLGMRWQ